MTSSDSLMPPAISRRERCTLIVNIAGIARDRSSAGRDVVNWRVHDIGGRHGRQCPPIPVLARVRRWLARLALGAPVRKLTPDSR
jgi:hypothetical protein